MIRILHIVGSTASDGTTKQLALLANSLPKSEFEFHLCSLGNERGYSSDLEHSGIHTTFIGRHGTLDPLAVSRLWRHIRRLQPEIVHTWQLDAGVYGRIAARAAGIKRLIASERSIDVGRSDLQWTIERRLASHTDRIVVNGAAVRNFYLAHGLPQSKAFCVPNAVSSAEPARLSRSEFLAQLGLPAEAKLILFLGPLVKQKRLKELIWATDQLKAVAVPAHLLVVGEGPLRGRLERYRWQNRLDDRVHFLGRRGDVGELLAHTDVLWQAGAHEGQSSAILEAMSAGVPVVAADAAGNRELVVNGETGYLVPVSERAGFARWTLALLEDADLAHRLGSAGKRRVERGHRVEDVAGQYAALYRGLSS